MIRPPYSTKQVPVRLVEELVDDARRAPSAGFAQGIGFLALQDEDVEAFWRTTLPDGVDPAEMLPCPVVLLPFGRRQVYLDRYAEDDKKQWRLSKADGWPVPYWLVDAAFATMTLLLAATARGVGAALFGIFNGEAELRARHHLPEDAALIGAITLGYPVAEDAPPAGSAATRARRPLDTVLHWDTL